MAVAAVALVDPLLSQWYWPMLVGVLVAALSAYLFAHGVNRVPGASPKAVAGLTAAGLILATGIAVVATQNRTGTLLQALVIALLPYVGFRLVVWVVDRFTPSFTVSLLAGLAGMAVFAAAMPLLASGRPNLSTWDCIAIAAGADLLVGLLIGVLLKPLFAAGAARSS
jgi:thiol:disulfide interchange protein